MVNIDTTGIIHPFRRREVDTENLDDLLGALNVVKTELAELREFERALREVVFRKSTGDTKTRRVISDRFEAKLTLPDDNWDQKVCKWAWANFPDLASVYLRIGTILPNLREVKKLESSSGDAEFLKFREVLLSARSPSTAPPTVSITER